MIPVLFISTLLNIPKFLESDIIYSDPWDDFNHGRLNEKGEGEFTYNDTGHIFVNNTYYKHIDDLYSDANYSDWKVLFDGGRKDLVSNINPGNLIY